MAVSGADGATLTWSDDTLGTVTLTLTHDHARQCSRLRLHVAVDDGLLGEASIHRTQLHFRVPDFGVAGHSYLATGCRGGESIRNPCGIASEGVLGVPGGIAFHGDEAVNQDFGSLPYLYLWDDSLERGLMVRIRDPKAHGKLFRYIGDPDTGSTTITVEMFPPGRRSLAGAGSSMDFDMDFDVELRPMRGSDWHAANWHSRMLKLDGHPAVARGTFASGQNDTSETIRKARFMLVGQVAEGGANDATAYNKFRTDMSRLASYFGATSEADLIAFFARVDTDPHGPFPGGIPVTSGQHNACEGVVADGTGVLGSYNYPGIVDVNGAFYSASSPALSGLVVKDEDGAIKILGAPYANHALVNFGHASARSQMYDYWKAILQSGNYPDLRIIYNDLTNSEGTKDDFNENIPADNRGCGDSFSVDGNIDYLQHQRDQFRASNPQNAVIGEFLNEFTARLLDATGMPAFTLANQLRRWMNYGAVVFGRYLRMLDWEAYGPNNLAIAEDPFAYVAMIQFCRGQMLTMFHPLPGPPLIPIEGEDGYDTYWATAKDRFALYKRCFFDAAAVLRPYDEGLLLPPLPGGHEEDIRQNGYGLDQYLLPRPTLGVCAAAHAARIDGDVSVMVRVVNHRTTAQRFRVRMDPSRYPWIAGQHDVYLVDPSTGAEALHSTITNGLDAIVDVEPRPSGSALKLLRVAKCNPCNWISEL